MLVAGSILAVAAAQASGMVGLDYSPAGRVDLVAVDESRTSGLLVGESDGLLTPPLSAWGGWTKERSAWLLGLGVARIRTRSWTPDPAGGADLVTKRSVSTVRPTLDTRRYLRDRSGVGVQPWLGLGVHVVAPVVTYESDAWTKKEQEAWSDVAQEDRARLFGYGGRTGAGCEYRTRDGVRIGGAVMMVWHQGQVVDEAIVAMTAQLSTRTVLTMGFDL